MIAHYDFINKVTIVEPMLSPYQIKLREIKLGIRPTAAQEKKDAPKKAINKVSDKMKVVKVELGKAYPVYLAAHPICNIKSPVCTRKATCVNHTQGRGPGEILNQDTWEPACEKCNGWVEENHAVAEAAGHKKSRHKVCEQKK